MASKLNPYLTFDGNAREAIEFYASVLGGTPDITTFGDVGEEGDLKDKVMHASLVTPDGYTVFASDLPPGMEAVPNGQISLSGDMGEQDRLRGFWNGLSDGATVTTPLERQMWGDDYGSLVDRFGVTWMVDIGTEDSMG